MHILHNYEIFVMRNLYFGGGRKKKLLPNTTQVESRTQIQDFKKSAKGHVGSSTSTELCWYLP